MSSSKQEVQTLVTGRAFVESPRWHEGRLWFSDFSQVTLFEGLLFAALIGPNLFVLVEVDQWIWTGVAFETVNWFS